MLLIAAAAAASAWPQPRSRGLVAFTLIRGGPSLSDYEMLIHSRRCLQDAMPAALQYDDVAFHEGNVPAELQPVLRRQM
eukprot:6841276-Prymnesium_polylepis.1